jgi:hypothetical protein
MVDQLSRALRGLSVTDQTPDSSPESRPQRLQDVLPESSLNPGPSYIAPRPDLCLGSIQRAYTLVDFLPSKAAADRLLDQFWEAVHPIAKVVHRPTFEKQYQQFWSDISKSLEPANSLQALVFAVLFAATTSMTENDVLASFGVSQKKLMENFQLATEMGLGKANFLKTTKVQTLQAFVMYLVCQIFLELPV